MKDFWLGFRIVLALYYFTFFTIVVPQADGSWKFPYHNASGEFFWLAVLPFFSATAIGFVMAVLRKKEVEKNPLEF